MLASHGMVARHKALWKKIIHIHTHICNNTVGIVWTKEVEASKCEVTDNCSMSHMLRVGMPKFSDLYA